MLFFSFLWLTHSARRIAPRFCIGARNGMFGFCQGSTLRSVIFLSRVRNVHRCRRIRIVLQLFRHFRFGRCFFGCFRLFRYLCCLFRFLCFFLRRCLCGLHSRFRRLCGMQSFFWRLHRADGGRCRYACHAGRSPAPVFVCPQAATLHNSPRPGDAIKKTTNWLKSKTEKETVDTYLNRAYSMPEDIVVATSEPYVKSLKDDRKFDIKEQQQAFELLKMRLNRLQAPKLRVLLNQP